MTARTNHAGTVGGIALLGCVLMIVFVLASQAWTQYAPSLRNFIMEAVTWQFALGMLFMAFCGGLFVLALERIDP